MKQYPSAASMVALLLAAAQAVDVGSSPVEKTAPQPECLICENLVTAAEDYLIAGAEPVIEEAIKGYCSRFGPLKFVCVELADAKLDQIIDYLKEGKTTNWICQELELCPASSRGLDNAAVCATEVEILVAELSLLSNMTGVDCVLCKIVVETIADMVGLHQSDAEIMENVNELCYSLGPLSYACADYYDGEQANIVQLVRANKTAAWICHHMALCPPPVDMPGIWMAGIEIFPFGFLQCHLCTHVVEKAAEMVKSAEGVIEVGVAGLCFRAGPLAIPCTLLFEPLVHRIMGFVKDGKTVEWVCATLKQCDPKAVPGLQ